jgi:probable rRNA maturation factor
MTEGGLRVDLHNASSLPGLPSTAEFERWATAALIEIGPATELAIRLVDEEEGAELNRRFRGKAAATNVLSFAGEVPQEILGYRLLGDLVICAPVVRREAQEQGKPETAHWAHMVVHGALHLQGYDHLDPDEAREMERLERGILSRLGYPDPYEQEVEDTV